MLDKKRIYISDVHMGAGKNAYDWLRPNEANALADFLGYLINDAEVGELVLLGDTMDNWICPINEIPPTFDEIVKAPHNKDIVKNLKLILASKGKKVVYMPGNHDMLITKEFLESNFKDIIFGGSAANKSVYRSSRLLAEHGSAYAMFNAPDPVNDPGKRLPLGYFISRIITTKVARTGSPQRHYWTYIDDFLELLGPQKLAASVLEAIMEEAGVRENDEIKMSDSYNVPVKDIKAKYANLYDQWEKHYGSGMAFKSVMAEIGYLGDLADTLSKKSDTNIIIFGHSHDHELDKDSWFVKDRIYANCGSWCDDKKPCTFIETQKDDEKRVHHIRLKSWEKGETKLIKEEYVDL